MIRVGSQAPEVETSVEDGKAGARRYIDEVWNEGRLQVADEVLAANLVNHEAGGAIIGRDAFKEAHSCGSRRRGDDGDHGADGGPNRQPLRSSPEGGAPSGEARPNRDWESGRRGTRSPWSRRWPGPALAMHSHACVPA